MTKIKTCKSCSRLTQNGNTYCKKCKHTNIKSLRYRIFKNEYDFELSFLNLRKLYKIHRYYNYKYEYNVIKYLKFHINKEFNEIISIFKQIQILGSDSTTLNSYLLRYGIEEGTNRYNKNIKSKAINLDTYIKKYNNDVKKAEDEYKKYCESKTKGFKINYELNGTFKANLENFIEKYGETEGTKRYNNFTNKQKINSKRTILYWTSRGYTEEQAKMEVHKVQATTSKENYIKRHGKIIGLIRWIKRQRNWQKTLQSKPLEEILEINKKKSISLENQILRYGELEGTRRYNDFINSCKQKSGHDYNSLTYYMNKHGYKGLELYKNRQLKRANNVGNASNESLLLFLPIYEKYKEIFKINLGIKNNNEYCIWDKNLKRTFWFDFTIQDLKLIIEYNGETFHPNPKWDNDKWNSWINPFTRENADSKYKFDTYKINLAKEKGFKVLEVWSSDTMEYNIQKIEEFISSSI